MRDVNGFDDLGQVLDPPGPPPQHLRTRVLEQIMVAARPEPAQAAGSGARVGRRRFPARLGLGLAAGLVAAVAGGAVAVQSLGTGVDLDPPTDRAVADAASFLTGAARQVRARAAAPVRPDQFVYVESQTTAISRDEATGAERVETARREAWRSVDGARDGSVRTTGPDGRSRENRLPGCRDGKETQSKGGVTVELACTPHPAYRADLPTDPAAMLERLHALGAGTKNPRDQQAFTAGVDLVRETQLPPAVLAAVLDALARIPSVTLVGDVVDSAGRPGVAVTITEAQESRAELIFDRGAGTVLGERTTALDGGRILSATAVTKVAVVDRIGVTG